MFRVDSHKVRNEAIAKIKHELSLFSEFQNVNQILFFFIYLFCSITRVSPDGISREFNCMYNFIYSIQFMFMAEDFGRHS